MRLIRSFKRDILKCIENELLEIAFCYGIYATLYIIDNHDINISNYKHYKIHGCSKYLYHYGHDGHWSMYKKYIHGMIICSLSVNVFLTYSKELYFVNKCLIKKIEQRENRNTYVDYIYEKTEDYNLYPKVKNSIINNIRNNKLYQFIEYHINRKRRS